MGCQQSNIQDNYKSIFPYKQCQQIQNGVKENHIYLNNDQFEIKSFDRTTQTPRNKKSQTQNNNNLDLKFIQIRGSLISLDNDDDDNYIQENEINIEQIKISVDQSKWDLVQQNQKMSKEKEEKQSFFNFECCNAKYQEEYNPSKKKAQKKDQFIHASRNKKRNFSPQNINRSIHALNKL